MDTGVCLSITGRSADGLRREGLGKVMFYPLHLALSIVRGK